jgi:MFS transporter, PPP family, 3-phenylpropionic acid transporter
MRWLRALYLSNGLAYGSLYGFVPVLLQSRGFDPALVGLTTSFGSFAYTMALPAWGHIGDIVSGPRRTLQLACIPAALFALGLGAPIPVLAIILCEVVMSAGGGPAMALTDAMAVPELKDASREYARLRLLTSSAAAGTSVICGFVYAAVDYRVAPLIYLGAMAATIVSAQKVPHGRDSEQYRHARALVDGLAHEVPVRGRFGSVGEAFKINPRLVMVLCSVTCVFFGVMATGTYITLRISDLGGGPFEVGMVNGIGCAAEIPGLVIAGLLVARFGARSVLIVSSLGFAACMLSWIVLVDAGPILASRFVSGIFFSGIFVAYVLTMATMLPARLQSTGQTLLQASCFGIGAILANLIGGILYGAVGPAGVFGVGAACAIVGGGIGFLVLPTDSGPVPEPVISSPIALAG